MHQLQPHFRAPGVLRGTYGACEMDLSGAGIANPGAGHHGYLADFDARSLGRHFLYRVAVPDSPDLNAMQTELDMTDHAIRGVREVQFSHPAWLAVEKPLRIPDAPVKARRAEWLWAGTAPAWEDVFFPGRGSEVSGTRFPRPGSGHYDQGRLRPVR